MFGANKGSNRWRYADISDYQVRPHLGQYASAGHIVIARKRTQGDHLVQINDTHDVDQAHAAGLRVIHYHFAELVTTGSWASEAEFFWKRTRPTMRPGDLLMVDVETTGQIGRAAVAPWVMSFSNYLLHISGADVIGYAPLAFLFHTVPMLDVHSHAWVVAAWGGEVPSLGAVRQRFSHQYTDSIVGPEPHQFAGIGPADGNLLTRRAFKILSKPV